MRYHGTAADDLQAAVQALRDGTMTVDMEDGVYYAQLAKAVEQRLVRVEDIDREVLRALAFKRRLGLFEKPYVPEDLEKRVRLSTEHRAAAREIARKSIVLLKNDANLLPLATPPRILVTGPLADARDDLLGPWHARGEGKDVVSVLAAFQERAAASRGAMSVDASAEGVGLERNGSAPRRRRRAHRRGGRGRARQRPRHRRGRRTRDAERRSEESRASRSARQAAGTRSTRCSPPANQSSSCLLTGRALAVPELVENSARAGARILPGHRRRPRDRRRAVRRLQPGRQAAA